MPLCYYPRSCVSKMVSTIRSKAIGKEEANRASSENKRKKETLKERFIKNKRPFNHANMSPKRISN